VPVRTGSFVNGHPYIEILVSPDGKKRARQTALLDTGFSGFVSIPTESAKLMGLQAHATALYTLANGKTSEPHLHTDMLALRETALFQGCFQFQSTLRP
jgi:predicted aspartyl protease